MQVLESIAILAMAVSIAAAGLLVDPRAEAAFEAPKRLASLIAIVAAALAVLMLPRLMAPLQWQIIVAVLVAAVAFAFVLDGCKAAVFKVLKIS